MEECIPRDVTPGSKRVRLLAKVNSLRALKNVKDTCFPWDPKGFGEEVEHWRTAVQEFTPWWKATKMTITTKVHFLMHHLEHFIDCFGHGLVPFNCQGSEHFHGLFNIHAARHAIKDPNNPLHPMYLKKTLAEITTLNV